MNFTFQAHPAAEQFEVLSLGDELRLVEAQDGGWLSRPEFKESYG